MKTPRQNWFRLVSLFRDLGRVLDDMGRIAKAEIDARETRTP